MATAVTKEEPRQQKQTLDEMLAHLEALAETAQDIMQEAITVGQEMNGDMDERRFGLGDIAKLLVKRHGEDTLGEWAKAISVPKKTAQEYRTVATFYEKPARAGIRENLPNISYSHMRLAIKAGDLNEALSFLEECADGLWTVEQAGIEMSKRLTGIEPPKKLLDLTTVSYGIDTANRVISIQLAPHHDMAELKAQRDARKPIRVVLYEGK